VGFGGMSVGGMVNNRKMFGSSMLPGVDHLPHTLDIEHNAFSRGLPQWGAHLANELERLIALHDRLDHRGRHRRAHRGVGRSRSASHRLT